MLFDGSLQFANVVMNAATNLCFCQCRKPAFVQVDPGGAGGCEVQMKAWTFGEGNANARLERMTRFVFVWLFMFYRLPFFGCLFAVTTARVAPALSCGKEYLAQVVPDGSRH